MEVKDLKCPACDAPLDEMMKECPYCHKPVILDRKTVQSLTPQQIQKTMIVYQKAAQTPENATLAPLNSSLRHCYLSLRMYEKAAKCFEKAVEEDFTDSETYFYAAVCMLGGKKAFMQVRPVIDKILEYINAALSLEEKGIYRYFLAYIKKDYFARKFYRISPSWEDEYAAAKRLGCTDAEIDGLFAVAGIIRPDGI